MSKNVVQSVTYLRQKRMGSQEVSNAISVSSVGMFLKTRGGSKELAVRIYGINTYLGSRPISNYLANMGLVLEAFKAGWIQHHQLSLKGFLINV